MVVVNGKITRMGDPYGEFEIPNDWPRDGRGDVVIDWPAFREMVFARAEKYADGSGSSRGTIDYATAKTREGQR
jgi:hypothetical protein